MCPFDDRARRIDEILARARSGSRILRPELAFPVGEARAAVAIAWSLPALERECRDLTARARTAREVLAAGELSPANALRHVEPVVSPFLALALREPGLPPELAPDGWPWPELVRTVAALLAVARPLLRERLGVDQGQAVVATRPLMPAAPDGICPLCGKGPFVGSDLYERHWRTAHRVAVLRAYEQAVQDAYRNTRSGA